MLNDLFSKDYGIVKFVKVGEEYRFVSNYGNHCDLVKKGEVASSAGFIRYDSGNMRISSDYSMTLKLGPAKDDGENISKIIGLRLERVCKLCGVDYTTSKNQVCFGRVVDSNP